MPQARARLVEETQVQVARLQSKAAIGVGLCGVEAPEVSSATVGAGAQRQHPTGVYRGEGLHKHQGPGAGAVNRAAHALAVGRRNFEGC